MESEAVQKARLAQRAARVLAQIDTPQKNKALAAIADALEQQVDYLLTANRKDMEAAKIRGISEAMLDRLTLTPARIRAMAEGVRQVVQLQDPVGKIVSSWETDGHLKITKVTVPLGVIAIIFESRPNVTVDAAVLCLKSGNACVLRGGSEAIHSNTALVRVIRQGLRAAALPEDGVALLENTDRALVKELLTLRKYVDLAIPRGGAGLIQMVVQTATVPCIETGSGICHVYVDKAADLDMAVRIAENAKVSRPSTCNAMETLLVHKDILQPFLKKLLPVLQKDGVTIRGDREVQACGVMEAATEQDWRTEYNALILSVKTVPSLEAALAHIQQYGTHHSEAIVTTDKKTADLFLQRVDAAAVYVNASTRFTDGFEFGFGAEIGISTQKLHVRGPMGLEALVSYKYRIQGQGQIRL
ncbi:glutamate-5-semialdehyde dehydrogenase [Megasphaera lornae]|jgi:hypothetical protein|uniref:Gamma-glutamyl phosphate reductase n=1 Tax=Megasphaera lornae TaxID=1000568 RepID=D3LTX9_9FIRM|nr:glutamate-5-semialdehyde dehydrogenase [Megasphaera genomosp. type_1]EFD94350.1 glutamate-5-semialdehyde dehydrogenase [Megasphaera genomosp. type_1 str. 28L]KXB91229.1 glutamate-5-semialdehyde dehydrogenase [Veillonellaceae bacterium DNF00751]